MSRIGKQPVDISSGVTVTVDGDVVAVKGSLGELSYALPREISATVDGNQVVVVRGVETREARSFHGLSRTLIANMIEGVSKGYTKELLIEGVGFKAVIKGQVVFLSLGFAFPKEYKIPESITVTEKNGTHLTVTGISKQLVGDVAARIRGYFPAEPYKGKGIRYKNEKIRRKVGKTVA